MKTNLQKTIFLFAVAFFGMQAINAQYLGHPYGGTAPATSTVAGNSIIIECENFDSTDAAGTDDGANFNDSSATPPSGVTGTYYDKSSGNGGNSASSRLNSDVDISDFTDVTTNNPVTAISGGQGQEYQLYTVTISQDGNYTMTVNYATGGTGKRQALTLRKISDLSTVHTFLNTDILPNTGNSFTFLDYTSPTVGSADLVAGTYVLQSRVIVNGPNFNHIQIKTNSVLGTEEFDATSVFISNPVKDQLSIEGLTKDIKQISVYDLLGKRMLTRAIQNNEVSLKLDVNALTRGLYIVKLEGENNVSFSKKIVKQ